MYVDCEILSTAFGKLHLYLKHENGEVPYDPVPSNSYQRKMSCLIKQHVMKKRGVEA
jgi:hypothetical protein